MENSYRDNKRLNATTKWCVEDFPTLPQAKNITRHGKVGHLTGHSESQKTKKKMIRANENEVKNKKAPQMDGGEKRKAQQKNNGASNLTKTVALETKTHYGILTQTSIESSVLSGSAATVTPIENQAAASSPDLPLLANLDTQQKITEIEDMTFPSMRKISSSPATFPRDVNMCRKTMQNKGLSSSQANSNETDAEYKQGKRKLTVVYSTRATREMEKTRREREKLRQLKRIQIPSIKTPPHLIQFFRKSTPKSRQSSSGSKAGRRLTPKLSVTCPGVKNLVSQHSLILPKAPQISGNRMPSTLLSPIERTRCNSKGSIFTFTLLLQSSRNT